MREKLFKKKQSYIKSPPSPCNLNESGRSKKISKNDSGRHKSFSMTYLRQSQEPKLQTEYNLSRISTNSGRMEVFGDMWLIYMNLLILNNKFLFEENNKRSKNFFCELLHSQIDVSNKLFMLISRADEDTFNSYVNFINEQVDLKDELGKSLYCSENIMEHGLNLSEARGAYNKQLTVGTLQPFNYSSNLATNALEYPKVINKEGHFADLKKLLLEPTKENDKEMSLGASFNFADNLSHNRLGNLSFLDMKSNKQLNFGDSARDFPFSALNKSIPDVKPVNNNTYEKRAEDLNQTNFKFNDDEKHDAMSNHTSR